jgi:hypothetical protein
VAWNTGAIVRAPGQWVNYAQMAWSLLLMAWPISQYVRSTARMAWPIGISAAVGGLVACTWSAAQAPGDWVNYIAPALLFLILVALWLVRRWSAQAGLVLGAPWQSDRFLTVAVGLADDDRGDHFAAEQPHLMITAAGVRRPLRPAPHS